MSELCMPKHPKLIYNDVEMEDYTVLDTKFIEKNGYLLCEYCGDGPSIEYKNIVERFKYCPYCGLPIRPEENDPED